MKNYLKIFTGNIWKLLEPRIHNYGFWVSMLAYVPIVMKLFDIELVPAQWETITNIILAILGALGIVNNPTSGKWYGDTKENVEK